SSSTGTVIGIAAGVVVLVGLGVLFAVRRRASADDRE
ncbi:LPXTG cell wall anchor domain-containing protein, partial [Streptomyces sp. E5N91]